MTIDEKFDEDGELCFTVSHKSTYLKTDEIKRLIEHLQNVIKDTSDEALIWNELIRRSYGTILELNKHFKDILIDKCKFINRKRSDKDVYNLYVLHYISIILYASKNPTEKIDFDDYNLTTSGREYMILMKRKHEYL